MNNPIIELKGLSKHYKNKIAVDNLSLEIKKGEIFGLLGPNGAGKTTTILMLLGLSEPTKGFSSVCGFDSTRFPIEVKKRIGYLPDNVGFYDNMSALENLTLIGRLNNMTDEEAQKKAKDLLVTVGLEEAMHHKTSTFSKGMKQRLGLADVLIKNPEVIILDEPTLGIDPKGVKDFLNLIQQLSKEQNLTVLLSSHHLHHVQKVCDRVGIFVNGKLLACGDIPTLSKQLFNKNGHVTLIELDDTLTAKENLVASLNEMKEVYSAKIIDEKIEVASPTNNTASLLRYIIEMGYNLIGAAQKNYGLDEIYHQYFENESEQSVKHEKAKGLFKKSLFVKN